MEMTEINTIVAMVMSILPIMYIAYLFYRLEVHKLKIGAINRIQTERTEDVYSEKPVLIPKKD